MYFTRKIKGAGVCPLGFYSIILRVLSKMCGDSRNFSSKMCLFAIDFLSKKGGRGLSPGFFALLLEGIDFVIDFLIKYPHLAKGKINPVLLT